LTYRVRQLEDALDVLLFDRSARQARPTAAGQELLREASRLLDDMDTVANRVRRVATGWEAVFTVAVDGIVSRSVVMDLCANFLALQAPTRLRLRYETLSGTLAAITSGQADLALGVVLEPGLQRDVRHTLLGDIRFVYAVAPHHPLAQAPEPLSDTTLAQHRAVAVADSVSRGAGLTIGLQGGQDVFTVPDMPSKLEAQLRGLGGGFLPESLARPYIESGLLIAKQVNAPRTSTCHCAWRDHPQAPAGQALRWWLTQLERPATRQALLRPVHKV
jgi:DNA-binding transcriptional LysR family regulator